MSTYRCRSHDRPDCRDAVCRRQAERAGLVTVRPARASAAAASKTGGGNPGAEAVKRARAGELWVGPAQTGYGANGQLRGSLAHVPGGVCPQNGTKPDDSSLHEGWGRIDGVPNAVSELINGNPVLATDDSGLIAVGMCTSCRALVG